MTTASHRRDLQPISSLNRRSETDDIADTIDTELDHRVGLVRRRRTQAGRKPQRGGTSRQRRRRLRLAGSQRPPMGI